MRKFVLDAIDGNHEEVAVDPHQCVIAITKNMIYFCDHCTFNRGDGTLVFHTRDDEDEFNWDATVQAIQELQ